MVAPRPCLRAARGRDHWRRPRNRLARAYHRRSWPPLQPLPVGVGGGDVAAVGHTRRRGWRRRRTRGAHLPAAVAPKTRRRAAPRPAVTGGGGRGVGRAPPRPYPWRQRRVCPLLPHVGWHGRTGNGASERPPGAGTAAIAATGGWPLAGDAAARCAAADAAAKAADSVSPPCVAGRPRPRHGGGRGRTRAPHLQQRARRWRRARRLVARRAAATRPRAPRRRL